LSDPSLSSTCLLATDYSDPSNRTPLGLSGSTRQERHQWLVFGSAAFLVSVPVFFQAPLVRLFPLLSLLLTPVWFVLAWRLMQAPRTQIWGDLLLGFSWSWLAGSIYWGWFRWEPLVHLPIEAIGIPFALWGLRRNWGVVGNLFYLGSLLGTAITDLYFYLTGLIPYWRAVMKVDSTLIASVFQGAIEQIQTPWAAICAVWLVLVLLLVGLRSLQNRHLKWWAFGGAVLSTIVVDGLFGLAALVASL